MELILPKPTDLSMPRSKGIVAGFWIVTALFCLQIGFTAYAQLRLPQVAEAFTHLGLPAQKNEYKLRPRETARRDEQ